MALEIEALNLKVKTNATTQAKKVREFSSALKELDTVSQNVGKTFEGLPSLFGGKKSGGGGSGSGNDTSKKVKETTGRLKILLAQMKRIAIFRIIRTLIKNVAAAVREGYNNLLLFDKAWGNIYGYNKTASDLASTFMILKNNIGVLAGNLVQSLAPALITVMNLMSRLIGYINGVIAAFRGQSSYLIANPNYWKDYAEGLDKSAGSAKKLKNVLFGFDELNVLPSPSGSGSASNEDVNNMFIEKKVAEDQFTWAKKLGDSFRDLKKWIDDTFGSLEGFMTFVGGIGATLGILWLAIKGIGIAKDVGKFITQLTGKEGLAGAIGFIIKNPIASLIIALGAIVGGFILAYETSEDFRKAIQEKHPKIAKAYEDIKAGMGKAFDFIRGAWKKLKEDFKDGTTKIGDFFYSLNKAAINVANGVVGAIETIVNGIIKGINWAIEKVNIALAALGGDKIKIPKLGYITLGRLGDDKPSSKAIPITSALTFATGGIPDYGSLFYAGESGAELVGNVGGKTNVINEEQLTHSLASANSNVVQAIMQAAEAIVASDSRPIEMDGMRVARSLAPSEHKLSLYNSPKLVNGATF